MNTENNVSSSPVEEPRLSAADRRGRNQYMREFIPSITAYAVVLALVLVLVDEDSPQAKFWILLPVLPMVSVAVAVFRSVQRSDEYTRLVQLESMALGFGVAVIASLVFGFLGIAGVANSAVAGWVVFSAAMITWGVSVAVRSR